MTWFLAPLLFQVPELGPGAPTSGTKSSGRRPIIASRYSFHWLCRVQIELWSNERVGRLEVVIRILIVDDHQAIRVGLTSMLGTYPDLQIAGAASSGEEALLLLGRETPDILLLDLRMQHRDGLSVIEEVIRRHAPVRIIVLTSYETDEDIYRAVSAGAHGYLLKDSTEQELVDAIHTVHAGNIYLPKHIASKLAGRMHRPTLSPREVEVLEMMAKGLTNKQIGCALGISDCTARTHVANITGKLEVADRTEAVTLAIKLGVLQVC